VYEAHQDLEPVRELLGHSRNTTQIYASIRPPQLKRAVAFYEEQAQKMLSN
jgi:site-specific recombinase XerD